MMTAQEWEQAERREPGRLYVEPDYRDAKRQERLAYSIFLVGGLVVAGFLYFSLPA